VVVIVVVVVVVVVVRGGRGGGVVGVGRVPMFLTAVQQKEKRRFRATVLGRCLLAVRRLRGD